MNKNSIIAESFNKAVETGFDDYLEKHATSQNCDIKIEEDRLIQEIEEKWLSEAISEIDGMTPKEYINSLATIQDLMDFFIQIAPISYVTIPDIVIDRFKEYGLPAADMLIEFIKNNANSQKETDRLALSNAVFTIGKLKYNEFKQKLIGLLIDYYKDEMLSDSICSAIIEYGKEILDDLFRTFDNLDEDLLKENLLVCIAGISKDNPSDEVFFFLKSAFRTFKDIRIIVEVLGDYGDGRAIPMLRGYITKNADKLDKETFNLVIAIIKKLGGEIDDLVNYQSM